MHTYSSKMEQFIRLASRVGGHIISVSLVLKSSIFTAELYAVIDTISNILSNGVGSNRYTILSDLKCQNGIYQ